MSCFEFDLSITYSLDGGKTSKTMTFTECEIELDECYVKKSFEVKGFIEDERDCIAVISPGDANSNEESIFENLASYKDVFRPIIAGLVGTTYPQVFIQDIQVN